MRTLFLAALAIAAATPELAAQQSPVRVRYEILAPAELRATTAERAALVTRLDSGTVIDVSWTEELGPAHTRVTWNGQSGWLSNAHLRRVVTVRDMTPVRLVDTVRVTRVDTVIRVDTVMLPKRRP